MCAEGLHIVGYNTNGGLWTYKTKGLGLSDVSFLVWLKDSIGVVVFVFVNKFLGIKKIDSGGIDVIKLEQIFWRFIVGVLEFCDYGMLDFFFGAKRNEEAIVCSFIEGNTNSLFSGGRIWRFLNPWSRIRGKINPTMTCSGIL